MWVTHSTWWCVPNCFSMRPTISATRPPIPASTSSKMSVGTRATRLVTVWIARLSRDSSPPEATFDSGCGAMPLCVETRNSTCSNPCWPGSSSGFSATAKTPPAMARVCIASATCSESFRAAFLRATDSRFASARQAPCASSSSRRNVSGSPPSPSSDRRVLARASICGNCSGATRYLRAAACTASSRCSTSRSRPGSASSRSP
ncbi:hypothetical protein D3C83_08000 [compost metagenome]